MKALAFSFCERQTVNYSAWSVAKQTAKQWVPIGTLCHLAEASNRKHILAAVTLSELLQQRVEPSPSQEAIEHTSCPGCLSEKVLALGIKLGPDKGKLLRVELSERL